MSRLEFDQTKDHSKFNYTEAERKREQLPEAKKDKAGQPLPPEMQQAAIEEFDKEVEMDLGEQKNVEKAEKAYSRGTNA